MEKTTVQSTSSRILRTRTAAHTANERIAEMCSASQKHRREVISDILRTDLIHGKFAPVVHLHCYKT